MSMISPYRGSSYPPQHIQPTDERVVPFQEEEAANLRDYWIVVRKYRWTIIAFLLAISLIAAVAVLGTPSLYTATATLHIENQAPNVIGVPETMGFGGNRFDLYYQQTQLNLLKSRSLAAHTIQELGLEHDPRFSASAAGVFSRIVSQARQGMKSTVVWAQELGPVKSLMEHLIGGQEAQEGLDAGTNTFEYGVRPDLIDRYLAGLAITVVEQSQLVTVSFSSLDPALSREIVNAHTSNFIRTSLLTRFELTTEARQFLERKLVELKANLERSEEDLTRFRKTHAIVALDKGENLVVDRLQGLNTDLTQARSRRLELESLYQIVQQRDHHVLSQIIDNPLIGQIKNQITGLETEKARLATIFKPNYAGVKALQDQINQAQSRMDQEIRRIVRSISSDYAAAKAREEALTEEMERQRRAAMDLREKAVEAAVLEREVESNRSLYDNILTRTKETDLTGAVPISNIRVVDRADIPLLPNDGNKMRTLLLSVAMGLMGGIGVAFLRYYLDNTLKTPDDVRRFLHLSTLGMVPDVKRLDKGVYGLGDAKKVHRPPRALTSPKVDETAIAISHHPYSVVSESYQNICTSLLYSRPESSPRTILITSSQPKEGKTATAVNTAIVLARNGGPVLLIDADLRNGRCHRLLGVENGRGLTEVLTGNGQTSELIKPTLIANLSLLSRGSLSPNPAQLLGSERLGQLLASLKSDFSFIVIDSAPLLPINDTVLLAPQVDGVVVVVKAQEVSRHVARQACERLGYVRANILGVVLNKIDLQGPEYADYRSSYVSYYNSYGVDPEPRGRSNKTPF